MPNSGICEKSPQFQHLAASLGFIKKIEKVAIGVRNLIKNIDYAHLSPLFAIYRLNLGYSNREDFVIYFSSISIFLFGTKDMFPS